MANGENTKSIKSKKLSNARTPIIGVKDIRMYHQAVGGETAINLTSLVTPVGFSNPSPAVIANINLALLSNNLEVNSSARAAKIMEGFSWQARNKSIEFINGFQSLEGEVFELTFKNQTINGTLIADVKTPGATGELLEGQRDFNLGEAVPIENLNNQWPIQVFRGDGVAMSRNLGNAEYLGDDSIGNYQMIDNGDGFCQVIRFNLPGDVSNEDIMWASHGALGERPNQSVLDYVDQLAGQLDVVIEDLAKETGEDESRYQNAPNNSDLKAFGDNVFNLNKILDLEVEVDSGITKTKILSSSITGVAGIVNELTFTGLEIGREYRLGGQLRWDVNNTTGAILYKNGATVVGASVSSISSSSANTFGINCKFLADSSTVTFDITSTSGQLGGNGTRNAAGSYVQLTKLSHKKKIKDLI